MDDPAEDIFGAIGQSQDPMFSFDDESAIPDFLTETGVEESSTEVGSDRHAEDLTDKEPTSPLPHVGSLPIEIKWPQRRSAGYGESNSYRVIDKPLSFAEHMQRKVV